MRIPVPLRRLGFRCAHAALRVYWFVLRPTVQGVKCVLTDGERVLLVRHTYGRRCWDLPGGSVKRGESPLSTARREMSEELGVTIDDWRALGELSIRFDHRDDRIHCFAAELSEPELEIDLGELAEASWFPRGELPQGVSRFVRPLLGRLQPRS